MMTYSAAQAISPAIERTKQFLFQPFRLGRFLKLALVATLTEAGAASFSGNFPTGGSGGHGTPSAPSVPLHMPALHWPPLPLIVGIVVGILVIVIPLGILLSYLLIRLRFSYFECVLRRQDQIAPAWRKYHRQAMRYLWMSLCIGLGFWVVLIPLGYAVYLHFKPLFERIGSASPPNFFDFLPLIGVVVPLIVLLAIVASLLNTALSYFVLPRMALDDVSIGEGVGEVWRDIQAEPGQFALFVVLRFLVTMAATIVGGIVLVIPFVILVVLGAIVVVILKSISAPIAVVLGVPAAILVFGLFVLGIIGVSGTVGTFRRNYALLFYAGRYPELALEVWPPLPPVPPFNSGFSAGPGPGFGSGEGV
jgi:hypothetical protein